MSLAEERHVTKCQIGQCAIDTHQPVQHCPACHDPYHQECWEELGGCAVYGCAKMVEGKKAADDSPTYWGATEKVCPVCQETIPISVLQCPYCKQTFDDMRPKTRADLIRQGEDPRWREYRHKAIGLFVFSALGFTSPLALLIGGLWYRSHRQEIAQAGTTTQALSLTGLGISLLYVVLITFGLLVWHVRH